MGFPHAPEEKRRIVQEQAMEPDPVATVPAWGLPIAPERETAQAAAM